eukprot:14624825-Ditylum_brightwellii.AAC.1
MKIPATGTTAVTVGDDGSIIKEDGWGNDEGLTGVMFCTNGRRNHQPELGPIGQPVYSKCILQHEVANKHQKSW